MAPVSPVMRGGSEPTAPTVTPPTTVPAAPLVTAKVDIIVPVVSVEVASVSLTSPPPMPRPVNVHFPSPFCSYPFGILETHFQIPGLFFVFFSFGSWSGTWSGHPHFARRAWTGPRLSQASRQHSPTKSEEAGHGARERCHDLSLGDRYEEPKVAELALECVRAGQ